MTPEPLLTAEEVAGVLGVPTARVKKWTRRGQIHAIKIGSLFRYRAELVRDFRPPAKAPTKPPALVPTPIPEPVRPVDVPVLADFLACECCGWLAPITRTAHPVTQVHHIVQRHLGGGDEPANLVRLCPNCHVLAHGCLYRAGEDGSWPRTRDELLDALCKLYGRKRQP